MEPLQRGLLALLLVGFLVGLGFVATKSYRTLIAENPELAFRRPVVIDNSRSLTPSAQVEKAPGATSRPASPRSRQQLRWLGMGLGVVATVWLIVAAFGAHIGWGFAVLFGNLAGALVFTALHPERGWKPLAMLALSYLLFYWNGFGLGG